mgnify:CR=1 FL=1
MLNDLKPKSEFSRNVLTLMTGAVIAQAIPIAISPILTGIYSPEDFGLFALYISIASIGSLVATGRYELAIMLPKKDEDAINIVALSVVISFFVSFLTFLIVFIFNTQITNLIGNSEISSWLYFMPITILLTGIYQSFNYWSNRKKHYKRLAVNKVVQTTAASSTNLGIGLGGFAYNGLILGGLVGQGIATFVLVKTAWSEYKYSLSEINALQIFVLIKRYKKLPIFNLPNALIDGFRLTGIFVLIANSFATATLGQFSLAWKMLQTPMSIIGSSLSQVFFQKIASAEKKDLNLIVKKYTIKAIIISLPIFLIIYFFSIDIFVVVFGKNWQLAGEAASIMSPWLFLNFLTTPMANIFITLNKQEIVLVVSLLYMLVPISLLLIFNELAFLEVLKLITLSMSLILILYLGLLFIYTKKEVHSAL